MKTLTEIYFQLNGNPIKLSASQQQIFDLIFYRQHPRNQIIAPTQYGKSLTVALAVLLRTVTKNERFIILAPSEKKAQIIMSYIIEHAFDAPLFTERLELENNITLDRLRRERSRNHLTFKEGGGIMILTLEARNSRRNLEAAMGFGGNRLILDESSLIDDPLYATVKRMLGGYKYEETFLLEIGNPFFRNHFYRTWHDERYFKIFIDYQLGLQEGRYSVEFIEEMRSEAFFDVFYECKFPAEDFIDERGYRTLLTTEEIESRFMNDYEDKPVLVCNVKRKSEEYIYPDGELKLGVDIAGGGDWNVYVLRNDKIAWIESKNKSNDTMINVSEIQRIKSEHPNLKDANIFIDDIGIGRGVVDRCKELGMEVNGVSVGESPITEEAHAKYKNIKAEAYWLSRIWIANGGTMVKAEEFKQLNWIKYKTTTDKVLQIEPKIDLKKRTGKSPDFAEAFMLTFVPPAPEPSISWIA